MEFPASGYATPVLVGFGRELRPLSKGAQMLVSAISACVILVGLGFVHFYWALGGSYGKAGAIPSSANGRAMLSPCPFITAVVGIALIAMSGLVGAAAGLLATPASSLVVKVPTGLLALVFFARGVGEFRYVGFFKSIKGSLFAIRDTCFYSPLCMVLAAMIAVVAAN